MGSPIMRSPVCARKRTAMDLAGYIFLVLFLGGCSVKHGGAPVQEVGFPGEADLEDVMDLLDRRYREISALKALVKVRAETPQGKGTFHGILLLQKPDQLRFQGLDPLGRAVFDLVAMDEQVQIYLPRENRVLTEGIDRLPFLGQDQALLKVDDLLEVLGASGGAYLDPELIPALEKDPSFYILYLFYLKESQAVLFKKLWLERIHFRLVKEEVFDPEGQKRITIFFEDYKKVQDQWRPLRIRAQTQDSQQLSLDYSEIQLNPQLEIKDFTFR